MPGVRRIIQEFPIDRMHPDDVYLLNNPFTFQAMEKHTAYCAMIRLGLKVPQSFSQLLGVCQKAKADGTAAVILPGASEQNRSVASLQRRRHGPFSRR